MGGKGYAESEFESESFLKRDAQVVMNYDSPVDYVLLEAT